MDLAAGQEYTKGRHDRPSQTFFFCLPPGEKTQKVACASRTVRRAGKKAQKASP